MPPARCHLCHILGGTSLATKPRSVLEASLSALEAQPASERARLPFLPICILARDLDLAACRLNRARCHFHGWSLASKAISLRGCRDLALACLDTIPAPLRTAFGPTAPFSEDAIDSARDFAALWGTSFRFRKSPVALATIPWQHLKLARPKSLSTITTSAASLPVRPMSQCAI